MSFDYRIGFFALGKLGLFFSRRFALCFIYYTFQLCGISYAALCPSSKPVSTNMQNTALYKKFLLYIGFDLTSSAFKITCSFVFYIML